MILRKSRRKHKAYWTVLIVPTCYGRVRNLRIPGVLLKMVGGAVFVALAVSVYLFAYNLQLRSEAKYYKELKAANEKQHQEIVELKKREETIREKIQAVEKLDRQVRDLLGLASRGEAGSLNEGTGSLGGGVSLDAVPDQADSLPEGPYREEAPGSGQTTSAGETEWLKTAQGIKASFDALDSLVEDQITTLEKLRKDVISRQRYVAALPTRWPVEGYITSRFGYRQSPFGGGKEFHDGLDIAAGTGTPITAAGGGRVVFVGLVAGYGRTVIIDHGYGYRTQYSHTSIVLVKKGQAVKRGEVIARVGSTGRSTGPHLHFTVLVNGKQVDPLTILR